MTTVGFKFYLFLQLFIKKFPPLFMLCHAASAESIKVEKMQSPTKLKQ